MGDVQTPLKSRSDAPVDDSDSSQNSTLSQDDQTLPSTPASRNNSPQLPPRLKYRPGATDNFLESLPSNHRFTSARIQPLDEPVCNIGNCRLEISTQESFPQHVLNQKNEKMLYQVVYRGVVSLLREPGIKSGVHIGYGEIFEGIALESNDEHAPSWTRVTNILTGGYAVDAANTKNVAILDQTPKRTNVANVAAVRTSSISLPIPLPSSRSGEESSVVDVTKSESDSDSRYGYIFETKGDIPICIPINFIPKVEVGEFVYKVISSNPVPIRTGPALDAPCTTVALMPGTSHEVCLRVLAADRSLVFLRLTRRRGWLMEKRQSRKYPERLVRVMHDITDSKESQSCNMSFASSSSSSLVATPGSAARRRHRPPRRRREMQIDESSHSPSHVNTSSSFWQDSPNNSFDMSSFGRGIKSPSSNASMLLEGSSLPVVQREKEGRTDTESAPLSDTSQTGFFLIRVSAPRGLKILDAPHFQVNNLIHGKHTPISNKIQAKGKNEPGTTKQSIFQTMTGHHTTALTSKTGSPAVFDSVLRARKLPRGCVFEASKRMDSKGAFGEGDGLIKLSDNSGWAIVPKQEELEMQYKTYSGSLAKAMEGEVTRAFEEVGNAIVKDKTQPVFMRVYNKGGIAVSCPPASSLMTDDETSITSPGSSVAGTSAVNGGFGHAPSQDSDIASSVGSSFIDAMFRTPKKKDFDHVSLASSKDGAQSNKIPPIDKTAISTVIPCGMYFEVDPWVDVRNSEQSYCSNDFARIRGGQGWIPRFVQGKTVVNVIQGPNVRFGSFWFRVSQKEGIKVRKGPSTRAPSIRREDGVYFRFECGEYLRASEVVTFSRDNIAYESFAKLYRNRHMRFQSGEDGERTLASLTAQSEWVQISSSKTIQLVECLVEPRIERHRQGWRYNVVLDAKVKVRRGPSFEADSKGIVLFGGESVLVNERVIVPNGNVIWLRLRDGRGWVHNVGIDGEALMIPHSLKNRRTTGGNKQSKSKERDDDIAYNTIIARLFHNESDSGSQQNQGNHR
ncbi:unnamed protein product [Cylindrotheca closterium]|uniref:Uncharacterized protein n=1 Tax=Cylindrotheca closterium TaxID=2856 RepID=A0AAD2G1M3_9STRA|nr:unnamed protein product [Cylindrotheca closterium]